MSKIADAIARKKQQLPQYDYLWRAELPSLGSSGGDISLPPEIVSSFAPEGLEENGITEVKPDEINHRINQIDAPMDSIETKKNTIGSSFWYSSSHNDIGNISMTVDEYEDAQTLAYFEYWRNLIVRTDGFRNPPAAYKRDIKIIRMTSTELDMHVHVYKNYFPTEISPISYSYESSGIMQYNVSFTGDSVEHILVPAEQVKQLVDAVQDAIKNGYITTNFDGSENLLSILENNPLLRGLVAQLPIKLTTWGRLLPIINKAFPFY